MSRKPTTNHPLAKEIATLQSLVQDILIIQAAQAGIKKAEARKIVGVDANRVTRVWKHLRLPTQLK